MRDGPRLGTALLLALLLILTALLLTLTWQSTLKSG